MSDISLAKDNVSALVSFENKVRGPGTVKAYL